MNPMDLDGITNRNIGQRCAGKLLDEAVCRRDGVAVGIHVRVVQRVGHPFHQGIGNRVLQTLGLFMDRVPGVAQELHQIGFDQAVPANHPQSCPATLIGQLDPAIGDVLQQPVLGKPLDHPGNRWRR